MKTKLLISFLCSLMGICVLNAQVYQAWTISSGFNADVIASGVGPSASSTNFDVDGVNYNFVSKDFQLTSTSTPLTYGLPINGQFTSAVAATPNLPYKLASYTDNNSLRLPTTGNSGTLVFSTPAAAYKLFMLSTSGSGTSTVDVVVNFTDATTQTFTAVSISDWYGAANFAIQGFGRILRTTDALESGSGTNPRLYQNMLAIDAANQSKLIQSITVTKTAGTGIANIFGFSADAVVSCAPPTALAVSSITTSSAQISLTAPTTSTPSSYEVYYNTSNVAPTNTTPATVVGISGTSTNLSGLSSNTMYYVWVRSNCGTPGPWGSVGTQFYTGYCLPSTTNQSSWIASFTSTGASTNINYTSSAGGAGGYQNLTASYKISNYAGSSTPISLTAGGPTCGFAIWVDWNNNLTFESTERVFVTSGYVTTTSGSISVPAGTALGNYRMRVVTNYNSTAPSDPCLVFTRGEYIDYTFEVVAAVGCVPPSSVTTSATTPTSATFTWIAPSPAPALGYDVYYTLSGSAAPSSTTAPSVSGIGTTGFALTGLTPGTSYCLWVRSRCSATDQSSWTLTSSCFTTPPTNDNCGSAIALTPGGTFAQNAVVSTNNGATTTSDTTATHTCQGTGYNEVWYSVTVPASGNLTIETNSSTGSSVTDTVLSVFTGSCGALTQIGCDDDTGDGLFSKLILTGQTPGANLLIGVWNYSSSSSGQFQISAYDLSLGTNDLIIDAKKLQIYPNPFSDVVTISNEKDLKSITVVDAAGRMMKSLKPSAQINLADLQSGIYLIKLDYKDGTSKSVKAIKK